MKRAVTFISSALFAAGMFLPQQAAAQFPEKMSRRASVKDIRYYFNLI